MNTIDWDKIKASLNDDIKLEDKMFIIPMSLVEAFYSKLKADVMKDVIPIEWIEKQMAERENYGDFNTAAAIGYLLLSWEKENEK